MASNESDGAAIQQQQQEHERKRPSIRATGFSGGTAVVPNDQRHRQQRVENVSPTNASTERQQLNQKQQHGYSVPSSSLSALLSTAAVAKAFPTGKHAPNVRHNHTCTHNDVATHRRIVRDVTF